jgi:hypothetical protein
MTGGATLPVTDHNRTRGRGGKKQVQGRQRAHLSACGGVSQASWPHMSAGAVVGGRTRATWSWAKLLATTQLG